MVLQLLLRMIILSRSSVGRRIAVFSMVCVVLKTQMDGTRFRALKSILVFTIDFLPHNIVSQLMRFYCDIVTFIVYCDISIARICIWSNKLKLRVSIFCSSSPQSRFSQRQSPSPSRSRSRSRSRSWSRCSYSQSIRRPRPLALGFIDSLSYHVFYQVRRDLLV